MKKLTIQHGEGKAMLEATPASSNEIAALRVQFEILCSRYEGLNAKYANIAVQCEGLKAQITELQNMITRQKQQPAMEAISERFCSLVERWRQTRGHHSRVDRLVTNEAYQAIIGIGPPAIPLLLKEMEQRPSHWDWALRAITQVDPVPKEMWGDIKQIAAAWVTWGRENGYEW